MVVSWVVVSWVVVSWVVVSWVVVSWVVVSWVVVSWVVVSVTQQFCTSTCIQGLDLVDSLYTQCCAVQGTPHYPLLLSLLSLTITPYTQSAHTNTHTHTHNDDSTVSRSFPPVSCPSGSSVAG